MVETQTGGRHPTWQRADWDSAFFGLSIGRIEVTSPTVSCLTAAEAEAQAQGISCLYAEINPDNPTLSDELQEHGYRLVEVALGLTHPTSVLTDPPPSDSIVRRGGPGDLKAISHQVNVLSQWSRYAADRRFGSDAARRLYRAWVARAAEGQNGYGLLVAEGPEGVEGLATIHESHDGPCIDLIATSRPRSGAAQAMVGAAFELFGPGPSLGGPIAARNIMALRFSENMGYRVSSARYRFHRWLDEGPHR